MDDKQIEVIYNQTFPGLTFYYRDTTLSQDLISKYTIGQILIEHGFMDLSYKGGGLATNFRYLIASAHAKKIGAITPEGDKFGHALLPSNSYFKLLDIYKIGDKTQVFLLEIPASAVDFFAKFNSNIEEDVIKKARESFDNRIHLSPVAELQSEEWKQRTESPVGMNEKGEFSYDLGSGID